jgi:hypothetical protein
MKKYLALCLLCFLFFLIYSPCVFSADDENICYTERKYCKGCGHYHSKHYHVTDLDEFRLKGNLKFDYRASSIADSNASNDDEVQLFKNVLRKIDKQLNVINEHTSEFSIKIDLSENYIGDFSIKELKEFIEKNNILKNHLVSLNFSNNNITEDSFNDIKKILNQCHEIKKIDISYNNICLKEFRKNFKIKPQKVYFRSY